MAIINFFADLLLSVTALYWLLLIANNKNKKSKPMIIISDINCSKNVNGYLKDINGYFAG